MKDLLEHRQAPAIKSESATEAVETPSLIRSYRRIGALAGSASALSVVLAVLLLLPTLHNMYEVNYVHAADGPHEMMVYVQTTTDVDIVMAKINTLDQKMDGGRHQLAIGVMAYAGWPFYWYLRDYTNVCYNFPTGCSVNTPSIIIGSQEDDTSSYYGKYLSQQYKLRSWWMKGTSLFLVFQ